MTRNEFILAMIGILIINAGLFCYFLALWKVKLHKQTLKSVDSRPALTFEVGEMVYWKFHSVIILNGKDESKRQSRPIYKIYTTFQVGDRTMYTIYFSNTPTPDNLVTVNGYELEKLDLVQDFIDLL